MRRLAMALQLAAALAACDSGTATPVPTLAPGPTPDGTLASYDDRVMAFRYPAQWQAATFEIQSPDFDLIVFLSSAPMADPCQGDANSADCGGSPISELGPDGVLISWWHRIQPGWKLDESVGPVITIDGRRASVRQDAASPACVQIGGEEEVIAQIEWPQRPGNHYEVDACVRGPSIAQTGDQIAAMLASVRWKD